MVLIILFSLYILLLVASCSFQRKIIFYPSKLEAGYTYDARLKTEEIFLTTADGERINALFFAAEGKKVILYFHGNAGSLDDWQYIYQDFKPLGFNFLIIDYRGYGKSTGKISEKGLYLDSKAAYNFLIQKGFKNEDIIIYGRSIGTGVAVDLASQHPVKALILEAPFSSFKKLANSKYPFLLPYLTLQFSFNNIKKINCFKSNLLIFHGKQDELIPCKYGDELYQAYSGPKRLVLIPAGGHNNLPTFTQYQTELRSFLKSEQ